MAGSNTNVRETIKEVLGETIETQKTPSTETNEQVSKSQSTGETKSGDTPVYVSGIDISDIPEADRPRIKELLEKKAGLLEKGYQGKYQKVAKLDKALEDLNKRGISVEEADKVIQEYDERRKSNSITQEKKEAKKLLDNLMDTVPAEQRESLRQLRQIVGEETNVAELRKEIEALKSTMSNVAVGYTGSRTKEIESEINSLKSKYGNDLVDKYHDVILDDCLKYPQATVRKAFKVHADLEEIEQAVTKKDTRSKEKLNAITGKGDNITSSENISTKGSFRDLLKTITKQT